MTDSFLQTRRSTLLMALAAGATLPMTHANAGDKAMTGALTGHERDWAWLVGDWTVRHRRLKERLMGNTEWEEFNGASKTWLTLGGLGTVDDNVIEIPSGTYRAMGFRAFDPEMKRWAIWWLDARYPARIDPPVFGGFRDGAAEFMGDDVLRGKPIKVRFRWTKITTATPHWEQAFSPDGGKTWEDNWHMDFARA